MKLKFLLISVLLLACSAAHGQDTRGSRNAQRLRSGTAVPTINCTPGPPYTDVYIRTTTDVHYTCTSLNVWTPDSSGGGAGDVTAAAVITDNAIVRGDGGVKGVQSSGVTIDDSNNIAGVGSLGTGAHTISADTGPLLQVNRTGAGSADSRAQFTSNGNTTQIGNYGSGGPVANGGFILGPAAAGAGLTLSGGQSTTSPLRLRSTIGVGTTGADIIFQVGNNGATEAARFFNSGGLSVGTTTDPGVGVISALNSFKAPSLVLTGSTSGAITLAAAATTTPYTFTWPSAAGTAGTFLKADGTWATPSAGSGSPGGSDTQVQFNDGGVFGGDAGFAYDKTTNVLSLNGAANSLNLAGSSTGNPVTLTPTGSDADVAIRLVGKGKSGLLTGNILPSASWYWAGTDQFPFAMAHLNPDGGRGAFFYTETTNPAGLDFLDATEVVSVFNSTATWTPTVGLIGAFGGAYNINTGTVGRARGADFAVYNEAGGTITEAKGFAGYVRNNAGGTITDAFGITGGIENTGSGAIGEGYGLYVYSPVNSGGGTFGTAYGLKIEDQTLSGGTSDYAIWYNAPGVWRLKSDGIVAYYNPAFAQYTPDATNFERVVTQWNTNVAEIGNEAGGTGTLRALRFIGSQFQFSNDVIFSADNTDDIGASGATRPRTGYFGTSLIAPAFNFSTTVTNTSGTGSPEGVVTAAVSSTFHRTDGGASTAFYVKESGAGNTGWIAYGPPGGSGAPSTATYITQTADAGLSAEQAISSLADGVLKHVSGVLARAVPDTDFQSADADLIAIAALSPSNDDIIQRKAGAWTNRTMAQVKTDLALGFSDLSGSATDAQIPNTITVDLSTVATTANAGDSASSFFPTGTIEAARLPDAVADGATKGIASFTAADFNATSGNISLDYTNGQAASGSNKGFLTSADWTTFNAKVGTSTTDTLTNKTLTTPKVITSINDTNGNELLKVTATASAVNELTLANAIVDTSPVISATGDDTDIDITLTPKGGGGITLNGPVSIPNGATITGGTLASVSATDNTNSITAQFIESAATAPGSTIESEVYVDTDAGGGGEALPFFCYATNTCGEIWVANGLKKTFSPSATIAGLNVGSVAGDPSSLANGDLWYDSTANELTARINGATVALGAGGGAAGANPTASVGLTAVNGVATTFLRSDGAPALSQSIAPTWTGLHAFTPTMVDGTPGLSYATTMPSTITGTRNSFQLVVNGAGSSSFVNRALNVLYAVGYTGSSATVALRGENTNAGTGNNLNLSTAGSGPTGNNGVNAVVTPTTTGLNVGGAYEAANGNLNIGVIAKATVLKNSASNIGVFSAALNTGTTPIQVAGYFGLQNATPTFTSAALMADNGTTTDPIFVARDNGTAIFTIRDGGGVLYNNILGDSIIAPTVSGFGTSPSVTANNGTIAFTINVGTGGSASTGTITLPTATTGWVCSLQDITNPDSFVTEQTGGTTTTATVKNYSRTTGLATAWTASDILACSCRAY